MPLFKRDGIYYVDLCYKGQRYRESTGTGDKKLAENILAKRKVEFLEGKIFNKPKKSKLKFRDFAEEFLSLHSHRNKKPLSYKRDIYLINNLNELFANDCLEDITPIKIEQYKEKRLTEEAKPATVNRELACLKCMFNKAIEWGRMTDNPFRGVKLLKENNKIVRFLEKEEIRKLIDCCADHLRPIVIVALNTGMRKGEILGLKWRDINFHTDIITLKDTKSGKEHNVYMNELTKDTLISVLKNPESPYVFCHIDGTPYYNVRKSFETALKKANIIGFRFHDLRHTFASQLIMAGIDIMTVSESLGHSSIQVTERYAHLSPSHKRRASDVLGAIFAPYMPQSEIRGKKNRGLDLGNMLNGSELNNKAPVAQMDRAAVS